MDIGFHEWTTLNLFASALSILYSLQIYCFLFSYHRHQSHSKFIVILKSFMILWNFKLLQDYLSFELSLLMTTQILTRTSDCIELKYNLSWSVVVQFFPYEDKGIH